MSDLFFTKTPPLSDPHSGFNGFHPGTTVLKKGYVHGEGFAPLDCDVVLDRDVPIPLRDGVVIRADIFRPNHSSPVPAILCSSIFGKNGSYVTYDFVAERCGHPNRCDVPKSATSGLDAWECPDPAYWVFHDYAVVFMDPRGVGMSEGDAHYFGAQDASDNYDVIEWLAVQVWCSGRVTMAGNSWLGITQWYTAALNPPHLICIAPWEGHGNMYRDEYMRGGIPHINIVRVNMCYGNHRMEDLPAAMRAYPLMNDYWEDKAANFEKITCPAYVVASYTSQVHAHGTFEGFRRLSSKEKWLRIHNTQEWSDQHRPENRADLLKFYDYYLKDVDNGWEHTPRVRMSVLDPGHQDIVYRDEVQFPLDRQQFKKLYLDCANEALVETKPAGIHIPTRLFKQAVNLSKQARAIEATLGDITPFNAGKKKEEALSLLKKWFPQMENFSGQLKKYKVTINDLLAENEKLEARAKAGEKGKMKDTMERAKLKSELDNLQRLVDRIPPDILAELKRQQRQHGKER